MKYHEPGTRYYNQTVAEVYFDTVEHAEAAGFVAPAGTDHSDADDTATDEAATDKSAEKEEK